MADRLARAVLEIGLDDKEARAGLARVQSAADSTATRIKGMVLAIDPQMFLNFGRVAVQAIADVGGAIVELGVHGSDVADVEDAFAGLSDPSGE